MGAISSPAANSLRRFRKKFYANAASHLDITLVETPRAKLVSSGEMAKICLRSHLREALISPLAWGVKPCPRQWSGGGRTAPRGGQMGWPGSHGARAIAPRKTPTGAEGTSGARGIVLRRFAINWRGAASRPPHQRSPSQNRSIVPPTARVLAARGQHGGADRCG